MRASWLIIFLSVVAADNLNDRSKSIFDSCTTHECVRDNLEFELGIFNNINMSADPCDDFYEFACGNFDNVPPDFVQNKMHANYFEVSDLLPRMNHLVTASNSPHPFRPFKFLKDFMTSCHNMFSNSYNPTRGVMEDKLDFLNEVMSKLGGWPAVEGDKWNATNFDWVDFTLKAADIGVDYEVFLRRTIIYRQNYTQFLGLDSPSEYLLYGAQDIKNDLSGNLTYFDFMLKVAQFLGANSTLTQKELWDSREFELKIKKIAALSNTSSSTDGNKTHEMSVKEMTDEWPSIDWMNLLNWPKLPRSYITNDSIIIIANHEFITELEKLLRETPKRVQANYAVWKTVQSIIPLVQSATLLKLSQIYYSITYSPDFATLWCPKLLQQNFPELMSSYYAHHHPLDSKVKSRANLMALDVKQKIIDIINKENWLDDESRKKLIGDIETLEVIIGYPEELVDDKKMEEYFRGLEITHDDFIRNFHAAKAFHRNKEFTAGLKPRDQINWTDLLHRKIILGLAAFTSKRDNLIVLGIPILGNFFFNTNRPGWANYGGLGFTAGHEIGHIVDNSRQFFDDYAFEKNRWSSFSVEKFQEKSNCLIEQLGNLTFKGTEQKLDGQFLLAENIADHIGVKVAYAAYQNWVKVHGTEPTFPNLPYNSNQLFWLSFANQWCISKSVLEKRNSKDPHVPNDKRANVPLSNSPGFSKDFNCPLGSKMNPVKKCEIFE